MKIKTSQTDTDHAKMVRFAKYIAKASIGMLGIISLAVLTPFTLSAVSAENHWLVYALVTILTINVVMNLAGGVSIPRNGA